MCPISGYYSFVKHTDVSPCILNHEEVISMKKNDRFPLAKVCGKPAFWVLLRDDLMDKSGSSN